MLIIFQLVNVCIGIFYVQTMVVVDVYGSGYILFYYSNYIILLYCLYYFIILKAKIDPLMLDVL